MLFGREGKELMVLSVCLSFLWLCYSGVHILCCCVSWSACTIRQEEARAITPAITPHLIYWTSARGQRTKDDLDNAILERKVQIHVLYLYIIPLIVY